jgi:NAD(P)-dependent dehydrogenase (short-subunit alcohol dehydrogenase family)
VGRIAGKRAIVTGAARGIGAAIVRRFVAEGARVAVLDLPGRLASGGAFIACDVSRAADCDNAVAEADAMLGGIDILVNNAGIAPSGDVETMAEADWDRTFAVNVKSIFLMSRRVIPIMRAGGGGAIINIASDSAFMGYETDPAYCASKAAVVQLCRSMALRHARDKIRVTAVCPGAVKTEMWDEFVSQQPDPVAAEKETLARYPLGFAKPEEVAAAVLYLATDEARFVTGSPLLIDGGSTAL